MPDMDGIELISSLRGVQKELPILAISGAFSGRFLRIAKALGAVGSLDKPFRMAELLAMVDKILGKQSGWVKGKKIMEDEKEQLTHTCKNCGGLIYYKPYEGPERDSAPIVICPKCGNAIPELQGALIIAFERPET
jgi:DNA-binding response OmpR family regulator